MGGSMKEQLPSVSEEQETDVTVGEKIGNMAEKIKNRWGELSDKKKKLVGAATAGLLVTGATIACGSQIARTQVTPPPPEKTNTIQPQEVYEKAEFAHIEESADELREIIENAEEVAYYVTNRGGYASVPTFIDEGELFVYDDLATQGLAGPDTPGSWLSDVESSQQIPTGAPVLAIRSDDGEERLFITDLGFTIPESGGQIDLSKGLDLDVVVDGILELNDNPDSPDMAGAELIIPVD